MVFTLQRLIKVAMGRPERNFFLLILL